MVERGKQHVMLNGLTQGAVRKKSAKIVDYLGVMGSNTKRSAAGCNRKANKENNRFANQLRTKYGGLKNGLTTDGLRGSIPLLVPKKIVVT